MFLANEIAPEFFNHRWILEQGNYLIRFREDIKLPDDIFSISIQRSSVMRCGATVNVGLWDAGYHGRGVNLLSVHNPKGLILYYNARLVQMLFVKINPTQPYNGTYQKEGVKKWEQ